MFEKIYPNKAEFIHPLTQVSVVAVIYGINMLNQVQINGSWIIPKYGIYLSTHALEQYGYLFCLLGWVFFNVFVISVASNYSMKLARSFVPHSKENAKKLWFVLFVVMASFVALVAAFLIRWDSYSEYLNDFRVNVPLPGLRVFLSTVTQDLPTIAGALTIGEILRRVFFKKEVEQYFEPEELQS